ncbi:MAG: transcriptional regulator NrdR [Candidatus Micrarchaeota archaeon]|nr:transcriptional regulator NrdR [Candidatus Micrarchaeota archaeon]
MKCPYCSHAETKVVDSREPDDFASVRRRRECLECGKRFTTYERAELVKLLVIKKDGRREQFDKNKLITGMLKACEKRPVSAEAVSHAADEIERELRRMDTTEIPSWKIGEMVIERLKKTDKVAYIRFASVYRSFEDVESFEKEVSKLLRNK